MKLAPVISKLESYRGRFLLLTLLVLVIILLLAYQNWKELNLASEETSSHIITRNKNQQILHSIIEQFQVIKVDIFKFSLDPASMKAVDLNRQLTRLLELSEPLDISLFDDVDAESLNNFIVQIPYQLHSKTSDLIELRSNPRQWIPATGIISEQLQPLNLEIQALFSDIEYDTDLQVKDQLSLVQKLDQLKDRWLSVSFNFCLLFSNRVGIYDATLPDTLKQIENLDLLQADFARQLTSLKNSPALDQHEFVKEVLLEEIMAKVDQWHVHSNSVIELIKQPHWRSDIPTLLELEDLLNQFNQTIVSLSDEMTRQSNVDITKLNNINRSAAYLFLFLCLMALLFALSAYLILEFYVLRPIEETTLALTQQATGQSQELDVRYQTSETRALVEAFNRMSEMIRQRESRLDYIAHHDTLTNLPNRLLFNERLEHAITLTERNDKKVAMMMLDLDRFKLVNDTLGHLFGDKLLMETANRLRHCIRHQDTIARLGGDEFAIILEQVDDDRQVETTAEKIIQLFEKPFFIDNQEVHSSTSIGIAMAPTDSVDVTTLVRFADIAMYQSKNAGRNQYTWFNDDMVDSEESIINFENQLREAITLNQFELYYQPQIDTQDPGHIAFETLLRWNHPHRGLLNPDQFISILDNSDLLCDLTCWVIRHAAQFQKMIERKYSLQPKVAINLHAVIFSQKHYRDRICQQLTRNCKEPRSFVLEVTEDTLITDMKHASDTLQSLHQKGFSFALDDFGTGQSSLSHLRSFPIQTIKIDREFIDGIHSDTNDANLVSAIISLGHDLKMQVIAEGVETRQQLDFIEQRGCHLIQGFFFAGPMKAEDYLEHLEKQLQPGGL